MTGIANVPTRRLTSGHISLRIKWDNLSAVPWAVFFGSTVNVWNAHFNGWAITCKTLMQIQLLSEDRCRTAKTLGNKYLLKNQVGVPCLCRLIMSDCQNSKTWITLQIFSPLEKSFCRIQWWNWPFWQKMWWIHLHYCHRHLFEDFT